MGLLEMHGWYSHPYTHVLLITSPLPTDDEYAGHASPAPPPARSPASAHRLPLPTQVLKHEGVSSARMVLLRDADVFARQAPCAAGATEPPFVAAPWPAPPTAPQPDHAARSRSPIPQPDPTAES